MSIEHAFLKALEVHPTSKLGVRVRRAVRRAQNGPASSDASRLLPDVTPLAYRASQLGRRWASVRLDACPWVAPIDRLRAEWGALQQEIMAIPSEADRVELLYQLAAGAGLRSEVLDQRGRNFLVGLLASRPGDCAEVCRVDGVQWFSPYSVLVECVNDLTSHSAEVRRLLRDFLSARAQLIEDGTLPERMRRLCRALTEWWALKDPHPGVLTRGATRWLNSDV